MDKGHHFSITDIQTVTFPLPSNLWTLKKNRRFFVSVSDGRITKNTRLVLLNQQSLHWGETLAGFTVDLSSQVTLKVFEKHGLRDNVLLGTFFITHEVLRSSQNAIFQSVDNSKKKKTPSREISVTWSECRVTDTQNVEETRSRLGVIKEDALLMKNLAADVTDLSDSVGQVLDTADKVVTSMQVFVAKCKVVNDRLGFVVRAVVAIAEVHPYAQIAWSVVSFIPKKISEQIQLDQDVMDLLDAITLALDLGPDANGLAARCKRSKNHEKTFVRLLEQISECGHFIQSYVMDVSFWKRLMKHFVGDGKTIVDNYRQTLEKLRGDFLREVIVTVEINVFRILAEIKSLGENINEVNQNIKGIDLDMKLRDLPYGEGTGFDRHKRCLPQTRLKFLDAIVKWMNDPDPSSPKVLALLGQAGTGKSSIAHEIAHRSSRMNRLTTSYFFVRGSGREPYRFFTTLARDLCRICPAFKAALGRIINERPELAHLRNYAMIIESLLQDPAKDLYFVGPIFVVIDALDENDDATHKQVYADGNSIPFHTALLQCVLELPSNFRFLITSRPEANLLDAFPESLSVRHMHMDDQQLAKAVDNDIRIYMDAELNRIGIDEGDRKELVKKAEGLFQWASVACDYIAHPPHGLNSKRCIQRVLNPPTTDLKRAINPLDALYTTVLGRFEMTDPEVHDNFQSAMRQILGSFRPLSVEALTMMRRFNASTDSDDLSDIVKGLGSLLSHVTSPESALPVAPLHTSFRDFLTDETRSGAFYVNLDNSHEEFALATLRTMQQELKFNICKLKTSYLLNSEVLDLRKRTDVDIPPALSYSCRFWADHLAHVFEFNSNVFESLRVFMNERFLFWLEVLSVRGEVAVAKPALLSLQGWLNQMQNKVEIEEIDALVKDAIAFVRYFGYPIAQSAPHIYLSALPFSPSSSVISKLYSPRFSTLRLDWGRLTKWPALEMTIPPADNGTVGCIAWSRDGEYIAAGTGHVWSTSTGMLVGGRLDVEQTVLSITFSPDGQRVALGSWSGEIWIWEVMKGKKKEVRGPWIPERVSAVAFSEDGRQLLLGLHDGRVWVWDLEKATAVGEAFIGHIIPVWAVSFLDEEHIVSRSGSRTVRVWNMKTRESVTRMDIATGTIDSAVLYSEHFFLERPRLKSSFEVCSWTEAVEGMEYYWNDPTPVAAFSPDGKLVATCSPTHVHVWFAKGEMAGSLAGGPFSNENGICLAFSSDGRRIACVTYRGTLRVWNVQLVDQHEASSRKEPHSVALMPGGGQIVVGWKDGRVSVLDASMREEVVELTEGDHGNEVMFVGVSPNGDRIVSTRHYAMCIWTRTGEAVAGPLTHTDFGGFSCVAFPPDSDDLVAYVAYGTPHGAVYVLDASTGVVIAGPKEFNAKVTSLALSPSITSHSTSVAVGVRHEMFVWDTLTGNVAGPFMHHGKTNICGLSSDGKYITSVAEDYTICIWDSLNGMAMRGPVEFPDRLRVTYWNEVALAPGGRRVAFTGIHDTILLFDLLYQDDSDVVVHSSSVLAGHAQSFTSFAFSEDGQYLATSSYDRTIKVWDLQAVLEHKRILDKSASQDGSEVVNLDETRIDDDGWAACANRDDDDPALRRLIWVPEIHRNGLYRPSNTCVVGGQLETQLDLQNFVHGTNWVKCLLGLQYS